MNRNRIIAAMALPVLALSLVACTASSDPSPNAGLLDPVRRGEQSTGLAWQP